MPHPEFFDQVPRIALRDPLAAFLGSFGDGGQTHTAEGTTNPWWEVDLGQPTQVDRVVLWNEDSHPYRMIGARVSLLDPDRTPVWQQTLPFSPDLTAAFLVDEPTVQIVRAGADSERKDFPASHAIEYHDPKQHGWSPQKDAKVPQGLVLGFEQPVGPAMPASPAPHSTGERY